MPEEGSVKEIPVTKSNGGGKFKKLRAVNVSGGSSDSFFSQSKRSGKNGNLSEETILVKRTLRSGQRLIYKGNIVIMGDVNPGAEVVAGNNIIVMGSLRGIVHAGANGNERAVVAAFRLRPTQLRIASYITRAPENDQHLEQPEIAFIQNGVVVIQRYSPSLLKKLV